MRTGERGVTVLAHTIIDHKRKRKHERECDAWRDPELTIQNSFIPFTFLTFFLKINHQPYLINISWTLFSSRITRHRYSSEVLRTYNQWLVNETQAKHRG